MCEQGKAIQLMHRLTRAKSLWELECEWECCKAWAGDLTQQENVDVARVYQLKHELLWAQAAWWRRFIYRTTGI